jgi:2-polyprenyl-6-methoxyphenol hydroxylase-like FAD-dependent oxidoreductase
MLDHAVVMGGSVAGLCAAAALRDVAKSVTLLERDADPCGAAPRKGTPQSHHAHVLLNLGARSLETLFPGVLAELRARGAVHGDAATICRWFLHGRWRPTFVKGLEIRMQTRPLLEACLREHLQARPGVTLRFDTAIDEPVFDRAAGVVRGVKLTGGERLDADLVVDATGRGSKSPGWFEQWGFGRPGQQAVGLGLAYVSGLFEIPRRVMPSEALMIYPLPPSGRRAPGHTANKRGGAAFHVEGDRWVVTQFGYHGDHAPTDLAGFRDWAASLARPDLFAALEAATLTGELRKFTFPRQIRNLYEKLPRLPGNYVVQGDAVCSFDPVFGQGMSVAAAEAVALRRVITERGVRPGAIQRAFAALIDDPWQLASAEAHRWAEADGWRPPGLALLQKFTARLHDAAAADDEVYGAFLDVVHLDKRPTSLFGPRLVWKILRTPADR